MREDNHYNNHNHNNNNMRLLRNTSSISNISRLNNSFSVEVSNELKLPLLKVFFIWLFISFIIIIFHLFLNFGSNDAVFVGSFLSIIGTILILFSAYNSEEHEKKAFQFIFYLTISDFLFAVKMLASACIVLSGRSRDWQDQHDGWCYFSALLGQFAAMSSMGWSFSIVIDLLLIVFFPLHYGRKKKRYIIWYHILVWGISATSCIPPLITNHIGMSSDGTCWFLGNYVWCFWTVWYLFVGFSIPGIIALYVRLRHFHETTDSISMSYVRVVSQSVLITFTFFMCWFWNMLFRMIIAAHGHYPSWILPLQIFWLGAVGFGNSIIWIPFIRLAIKRARERFKPMFAVLVPSRTATDIMRPTESILASGISPIPSTSTPSLLAQHLPQQQQQQQRQQQQQYQQQSNNNHLSTSLSHLNATTHQFPLSPIPSIKVSSCDETNSSFIERTSEMSDLKDRDRV